MVPDGESARGVGGQDPQRRRDEAVQRVAPRCRAVHVPSLERKPNTSADCALANWSGGRLRLDMGDEVLYEVRGSAAWLTLNRPERRNALNHEAVERLLERLDQAAEDRQVRSVVITGAGDMFCAGGDFADMSAGEGRVAEHERRGRIADVFRAMI